MDRYLFTSERLGFRNWQDEDLLPMTRINQDPEVMKFFPGTQDEAATRSFIDRKTVQFMERGFTYFAVELLNNTKFIGFIGLSYQDFDSDWTPFIDVGWRLDKDYWGQGLATEGTQRVLKFAFMVKGLSEVYALAPEINLPSIKVMEKVGMKKIAEFEHPLLLDYETLKKCHLYTINQISYPMTVS